MAKKETKKQAKTAKKSATTEKAPQPLFFKKPKPLLKDRHADAGIIVRTKPNYSFALRSNSVPINLPEFAEAAKSYPIVFTAGDNPIPVCILGLKKTSNLFVNPKTGAWEKDAYIPAYLRRYPFAFSSDKDNDRLVLCVDEAADVYVKKAKKNDQKFFDENGEQTELTENALKFCTQYHSDLVETQKFCQELRANKLLRDRELSIAGEKGKKPTSLSGFQTIDEEAFAKLPEAKLAEWHRNGLLSVIYFHLMSGSNWSRIAQKQG